jgi:predicted Fe-S protein YdhL (DUF1289 family)
MSPCIGVCQLRAGTSLCEGCLRTLAEISEWSEATSARRREILAAVARRRLVPQNEAAARQKPVSK